MSHGECDWCSDAPGQDAKAGTLEVYRSWRRYCRDDLVCGRCFGAWVRGYEARLDDDRDKVSLSPREHGVFEGTKVSLVAAMVEPKKSAARGYREDD
jgi:hypothetical protein